MGLRKKARTSYLRNERNKDRTRLGASRHRPRYGYFSRIRSKASQADISDKITLSPTFNPSKISIVLTELRPSFTFTRVASELSSVSLKSPIVLSDCPCTGLPTYSTLLRFSRVIVPSTLKSGLAPG